MERPSTDGVTAQGIVQGEAYLVRDIQVFGDSTPFEITAVGGTAFFAASGPGGRELWKTDGTEIGTMRVKNIRPDFRSSNPSGLTAVGDLLFFAATAGSNDRELWKSDGTSAGTQRVKDINPGGSSDPFYLANVNGTLFFSAHGPGGRELWKSDGTAAGTVRVKDLVPGPSGSAVEGIVAVGGLAFFTAFDSAERYQVWRSDGSAAGTYRLPGKDPYDGAGGLVRVGDRAYFVASKVQSGCSLETGYYRTDGTNAGTFLVADEQFEQAPTASLSGRFFYGEFNELRKANASETGSVLVKKFNDQSMFDQNGIVQITRVGSRLYVTVDVSEWNGDSLDRVARQLWRSDGTTAGTKLVRSWDYAVFNDPLMTNVAGLLFFASPDSDGTSDLWRSDGTLAGTVPVTDIGISYPYELSAVDGSLYFDHDDGVTGRELWRLVP